MLMDSKGKLFGKISIVDIAVIVILIVAIAGAYIRFNSNKPAVVSNDTEFYYTISINNIRESNKNLLENSIGTTFSMDGKITSTMGELVDVKVSDAKGTITKTDGNIVSATVPGRYDVKLTLKVLGNVNDYGYFTPDTFEICAAKEYNIKNIYCSVTGVVDKVWTE